MKIINRIAAVFTDVSYIMSPEYKIPHRKRLLMDYLRMRLKVSFCRIFKYKKEKFLGYTVEFANYSLFFEIFRQIFVRQSYYVYLGKKNPNVIDCGGNMGMSVLYYKYMYPDSNISVFEPSPTILSILKKNISENKLSDVKVNELAVSDKEEVIEMYDRGTGSCGSTLVESVFDSNNKNRDEKESKKSIINAVKLSDQINSDIDILKMDIEGVEEKVFIDLSHNNKINKVSNIILEYHWYKNNSDNDLGRIISILGENDFDYQVFLEETVPGSDLAMIKNGLYYCMLRARRTS